MSLGLYFRTARNLRWSQLLWRARYGLERRRSAVKNGGLEWQGASSPRLRDDFPDVPLFHRPSEPLAVAQLAQGVFRHLNQEHTIGRERPDWRRARDGRAALDGYAALSRLDVRAGGSCRERQR